MPPIFVFDEPDKNLIENARKRNSAMFAHVGIDPTRLATQPMANAECVGSARLACACDNCPALTYHCTRDEQARDLDLHGLNEQPLRHNTVLTRFRCQDNKSVAPSKINARCLFSRRPLGDWLSYSVGILLRVTGVQVCQPILYKMLLCLVCNV